MNTGGLFQVLGLILLLRKFKCRTYALLWSLIGFKLWIFIENVIVGRDSTAQAYKDQLFYGNPYYTFFKLLTNGISRKGPEILGIENLILWKS